MCCKWVIPFVFPGAEVKCFFVTGDVGIIVNWGESWGVLVVLWNFHQADSVEPTVATLKQGCFFIVEEQKGKSDLKVSADV